MGTTDFRGSFTALVTPFQNGSLDEQAFRALVVWQIEEGTNSLVPVGTTGESPTLTHAEHKQVVEWCIAEARGRVPVIAGAGSNSTREAIELAQHAEKAGAAADKAILVVDGTVMVGTVSIGGRTFQIRYLGDGVHAVIAVDQSAFPRD